jgi:hypothetical protein
MVTLGLMAAVSTGCRSESERKAEQSRNEPTANTPSTPPAQPAPAEPGAAQPEHQPPAIGGGPTTAKPKMTPAAAVLSLAAATCDHEAQCNNIGADKKYKTREECMTKTAKDKGGSLNAQVCTGGVNEGNLDECIKVLRSAGCGAGEFLKRAEACKMDGICVKK